MIKCIAERKHNNVSRTGPTFILACMRNEKRSREEDLPWQFSLDYARARLRAIYFIKIIINTYFTEPPFGIRLYIVCYFILNPTTIMQLGVYNCL
jgi:hypothetical protein